MLNLNEVSKKVNDFIKYLSSHGVSSSSLKYYKSDITNFFNWANGRIIDSSLVKEYITSQLGLSSLKTINRRLSTLRSFSQSTGESFMAGIGNVSVNGVKKVVEPNKILDFDKFLINQKVSNNTRKNYLSDIRKFLAWKKDTEGGAKEYLNNLPMGSYDRNSASLKKYYEFQNKSFPVSTNQIPKNSPYRFIQELILNKLDSKPRLQDVFHKVFFNRPNWYKRYHSYPVATYIHIAILVFITSISGYAIYDQVFKNASKLSAYPTALETPNRFLSFQGRLTDNLGNPKIVATNLVFKLYDADTAGTTLWDSTTCSITPDGDGIFSTLLGSTCGGAIAATVFSENADVWLGITIGADAEATPRIRIATVGYALNSETLQGFPPGTGASTIPYIDSTGKLQIAAASPTIESTSGTFAVTGQAMTISTANTTNGAITINPDGTGTLDLTFEGAAAGGAVNGFINATNANITSGSLYGGTVASAATGYNFIDFQSGVSPTSKFSIDYAGNTTMAGDLKLIGADILDTNGNEFLRFTSVASAVDELTIANAATGGVVILAATGGDTDIALSIDSKGADALNLNGTATGDVNLAGGFGGTGCTITNSNGNLACNGTITGTIVASSLKWNALTTPDGALTLAMGTNATTFGWTPTAALDAWTMNLVNNGGSATTQNGLVVNNAVAGSFTDVATENLILVQQLDTTTAGTTVVTNGIKIDSAADSNMTNGLTITNSAGNITTGINIADAGGTLTTGILISGTVTTAMDAGNFPIINIGAANTDFNTSGGLTLAENLVVQGTTGLTFSTGVGGDITFAYGEKIDNDTDGTIAITATNTFLSGDLKLGGNDILNSVGTGTIMLTDAPDASNSYQQLVNGSWLVNNTINNTLAALTVNSTKAGDLFTASASGTPKFVITNTGNVGVGTTDPTSGNTNGKILEVATGASTNSVLVLSSSGASASNIGGIFEVRSTASAVGDTVLGQIGWSRVTDVSAGRISSQMDLYINKDGTLTDAMVIDKIGNVGIGVTNPSATLSVGTGSLFQVAGATGNITTAGDLSVNGDNIDADGTLAILGATGLTLQATTGTVTLDSIAASQIINVGASNVARTINMGTGTGIDTINIGTGATGVDVVTIGNAGTLALYSNDWDIDTTGDMTGIGAITMNGILTNSTAATNAIALTGAGAGITFSGATTTNQIITAATADLALMPGSGKVGIGTTSPTEILSLGNAASRKIWIEDTAAGTAGRALTIASGGTVDSGSNVNGGNMVIQAGLGTGTGLSDIFFQNGTTLGSGLGIQTMSTKMVIKGTGNVGIGDTTPTEATLVLGASGAGSIYLTLDTTGTTNNVVCWDASGATLLYDCDAGPFTDYAEIYPTKSDVDFGDIVMTSPEMTTTIYSKSDKDGNIVSTETRQISKLTKTTSTSDNPIGIVTQNWGDFTATGQNSIEEKDHPLPVALSGRLPVKISFNSNIINIGDPITPSNNPGRGTKATKAGKIVGTALENWDPDNPTDTILVFVANNYYDPDLAISNTGDITLSGNPIANYTVSTPTGITEKIGSFAEVVVANIKAGAIETTDFVSKNFVAFQATVDNLIIKNKIISPIVQTNLISPVSNTDLIIDLQPDNSQVASRLAIKGVDDLEVASIDASGNASFSGEIAANSLEVDSDATISGTLYADNIESSKLDQIEELLRSVDESQKILAESVNWNINTATASASIDKLVSSEIITNNFFVTGSAAITSLFVSDNLTTKSINSLDSALSVQSLALAPVEIMAGKIKIETNGDITFSGNVEIAGNLKLKGNIVVIADAPLTATDSAQIVPGEINTNATAGKAILTASTNEVKIINPKINNDTLIYVTPLSSTQNKVLYVKSKDIGYFTVGFLDTLDTDVEFNWWVIELQNNNN